MEGNGEDRKSTNNEKQQKLILNGSFASDIMDADDFFGGKEAIIPEKVDKSKSNKTDYAQNAIQAIDQRKKRNID